jgi:uncharacterized protein (TIGR01777 family)
MKTVVVTGGTGLIGTELIKHLLRHNYFVTALTRDPHKATAKSKFGNQVSYAAWDIKKGTIDEKAISDASYIIHLAGAGVVDKKWTDAYKKEIVDSRVNSSELLMKTLKKLNHPLEAFISSSATGWYGADKPGQLPFTEDVPAANDFLGETCRLWEKSVEPVEELGIRRVSLRTGIVLSKKGGALPQFERPIKMSVAGVLGSGKQMVSWIHIADLCDMYVYALEQPHLQGSYNAVAPNPVTNETLTLTLARAEKGKWFIKMPVPEFALKLMMGERSEEVLKSTTVSSQKIQAAGFEFRWPEIKGAIDSLVK